MSRILAIDEGTTGVTSSIADSKLRIIASSSIDFPQHFPKPGWVEHDLSDIWDCVQRTIKSLAARTDLKKLAAIGITNQRETLCFWDKLTGRPLTRALVWQDRRTAAMCAGLKAKGLETLFRKRTGLLLDPYFSATKASWAFKNWGVLRSAHRQGRLAAGTIDSYLVARLSGARAHVTDPSNACRTLVYDIHKHRWDADLCKLLGLPVDIWPQVQASDSVFARSKGVPGLPDGIPINGILGDQQAALFGQACLKPGQAKCTYGTGAFIVFNTGAKPIISHHRLLSSIAWQLKSSGYTYMLEGSAFVAGAAVQWLRDGLGIISSAEEIETLATRVPSSNGVVFVPAMTGLGAPYWQPKATALLTGITRGTTKAHIARAVLEGIAFQVSDLLAAMHKDTGLRLKNLNVDGGAAANDLLMQFQADILGIRLQRPRNLETTSLGTIFVAGLGVGIWPDTQTLVKTWKKDRDFTPGMTPTQRDRTLQRWRQAIRQVASAWD
ncbi:MAG: glycerol kinase GlpK [Elusimicrobiota bacterium]